MITIISIISWIIGLLILYIVIYFAVKHGINNSMVGRFIENNYVDEANELNEKSFLDSDLDNDK